jgi:hypothetical protein
MSHKQTLPKIGAHQNGLESELASTRLLGRHQETKEHEILTERANLIINPSKSLCLHTEIRSQKDKLAN